MPLKPVVLLSKYHETARSMFSTPLQALRELLDNTLAPSSQRNKPFTGDGKPMRVNIDLATREFRRTKDEKDKVPLTYIQWGSDGQPIRFSDVGSILDVGHKHVDVLQHESPCASLYGRHGHGQLFAYLALSQFTIWLGHANINGQQESWAALVGQNVNSKDGCLLNITYKVPQGAESLQDLLSQEDPETGDAPHKELAALLQILGGSKNTYVSPFYNDIDLLNAYKSMEEKGETLRAYIFLDRDNAAALCSTDDDIVWSSGSTRKSLKTEILGWYMPLPVCVDSNPHLCLRLRDHLRAPPMDHPPHISLQGSPPLDWGLRWREEMQKCMDNRGPNNDDVPHMSDVLTLCLGDDEQSHVIKYQVLEKPSRKELEPTQPAPEPRDGFIVFADSDRYIKGPFAPPAASIWQNEYIRRMEMSAPSRHAYLALLSMLDVKEADVQQLGLPTCEEFTNCKRTLKPLLRRLGGRDVSTYIMLDRVKLAAQNLIIANKSEFHEASHDMWNVLLRAQAKAVWQRHAQKEQELQQQLQQHRQQQRQQQQQQQWKQQQWQQEEEQVLQPKPELGGGSQPQVDGEDIDQATQAAINEALAAPGLGSRVKTSVQSRQQKQQEQKQQKQQKEQELQQQEQKRQQQQRGTKRGRPPSSSPAQTPTEMQQQAVRMADKVSGIQSSTMQLLATWQEVQGAGEEEQEEKRKRLRQAQSKVETMVKKASELEREAKEAKKSIDMALSNMASSSSIAGTSSEGGIRDADSR